MTGKTHKGGDHHTRDGGPQAPKDHAPEASIDDQLAVHRGLAPVEASQIPVPPDDFKPTDGTTRRRRLRRVADKSRSQATLALNEVAGRGAALQTDLGQYAPPAERGAQLSQRLTTLSSSIRSATQLLTFLEELDEIALSDAALYLDSVNKEYEHALSHKPSLATSYEQLEKFIQSRSDAIVEGIANARSTTTPEPAKKDG
jgi:hypothetical protein